MIYELKQLSFGQTIRKAFDIYLDNFTPLILVALITNIPSLLQSLFFPTNTSIVFTIIDIYMGAIQAGLIVKIVAQRYLGNKLDMSLFWKETKLMMGALVRVALLSGLYIVVGTLLLIIPGIYFLGRYSVATQILIIEGCDAKEALARSKILTQGRIGSILLLLLLSLIISIGFVFLFPMLTSFFIYALFPIESIAGNFLTNLVSYISMTLATPLSFCLLVLIYFNLRIEKEGFDVEHLTNEFSETNNPVEEQI